MDIPLSLPFNDGNNLGNRLGHAGRGGDDADGSGAGAAQVFMEYVQNFLVVGVRVNRCHKTLIDAEGIVQDFGDRGHAVGGAGSVGNDIVFRGSYVFSLTPRTMVISSLVAGAEIRTFFAPPLSGPRQPRRR